MGFWKTFWSFFDVGYVPQVRLTGIYNECCKKNEFYLVCKHCNRVFEYKTLGDKS